MRRFARRVDLQSETSPLYEKFPIVFWGMLDLSVSSGVILLRFVGCPCVPWFPAFVLPVSARKGGPP